MASNSQAVDAENRTRSDVPAVIRADEHGTVSLAVRDTRVSDSEAFDMPDE